MTLTQQSKFRQARRNLIKAFEEEYGMEEVNKISISNRNLEWYQLSPQEKATVIMQYEGELG